MIFNTINNLFPDLRVLTQLYRKPKALLFHSTLIYVMYILTDYKLIILALLPFKNQLWSLQMNITHTLDIILLNCKFFDSYKSLEVTSTIPVLY